MTLSSILQPRTQHEQQTRTVSITSAQKSLVLSRTYSTYKIAENNIFAWT